MIRRIIFSCLLTTLTALHAQTLDIYFIDVEGGAATLIVTPEQEGVLIDTGWEREDQRDAKRIFDVVTREAGLKRINHLLTTHFHRDHYGGILSLSGMIPIENFYDHGPVEELPEDSRFAARYARYEKATRGEHRKLKPGDEIPLRQGNLPLQLLCLVSDREVLSEKGRRNPECLQLESREEDPSDNARSVGLLLRFGDFEFLDLGDLTWNVEANLVCPVNVIGEVDAYQVTHHGLRSSNNSVLVRSVKPTVAIMNNGPRKGGHPDVFALLNSIRTIRDIFQVHLNLETGAQDNAPPELIANLGTEESCTGHWIRLSAAADSSTFTVTNSRNQITRAYPAR